MSDYLTELATERSMKDQFMAHHAESPFVSARLHDFSGLQYFPPDEAFRLKARLRRSARPEEAFLRTNRDGQAVMRYLGDLEFEFNHERLRLRVFHAGEGVGTSVFVPFRDRTSGKETYSAGRYLTIELSENDEYELDFNRAFNPYCAYTDAYECPFPPVENDLPVAIRAGEKSWTREAPDVPAATRAVARPRTSTSRRTARRTVRGSRTRPKRRTG